MDFFKFTVSALPLTFFIFLYIVFSICIVSLLKKILLLKTAYTRKIFHFLIFFFAAIIHFMYGIWATIFLGSIVFTIVFITAIKFKNTFFYKSLAREKDEPYEQLFILIPLFTTAIGGLISHLLFPAFAFIGYLIGGVSDALAEPIGSKWGKHPYKVHSIFNLKAIRTIEGSIAIFVSSLILLYLILRFLSYSTSSSLSNALIIATVVTIVEAFSTHGFDNLTVQLSAAGTTYYLLT